MLRATPHCAAWPTSIADPLECNGIKNGSEISNALVQTIWLLHPSNPTLLHGKYGKRSLANLVDDTRLNLFAGQTTRLWLMHPSLAGIRLRFSLVADLSGMAARYGRARATAF